MAQSCFFSPLVFHQNGKYFWDHEVGVQLATQNLNQSDDLQVGEAFHGPPPYFIQSAIFLRSTHQAARMSSHDQQKLALASATTGPTIFLWSTPGRRCLVHRHNEMMLRGGPRRACYFLSGP